MAGTILEVDSLKTYFYSEAGVVKAVDGVSFDLASGEIMALVGESGSGKSVTALSILRLVTPPGKTVSGQVNFKGEDLLGLESRRMMSIRGRHIAMVFQEPMTSLNPVMSIGEQIAEPLRVHLQMDRKTAQARALGLLRQVGITDPEERYGDFPHQFSGGMRQRVMIAIAMSCGPDILIADEPTTALDVTIQAQVLDLMAAVARQSNTAVLLITHNLGIVARYADRVNVMQAGRVVETGPAEDIFSHPQHHYTQKLLRCVPRLDSVGELSATTGSNA